MSPFLPFNIKNKKYFFSKMMIGGKKVGALTFYQLAILSNTKKAKLTGLT